MIDFSKLDKLIHESGRLAIMTVLASHAEWTFPDLREELNMSDGNLITHLRKLEAADYVTMTKVPQLVGRPITKCALTSAGREAFAAYLSLLEEIIQAQQESIGQREQTPPPEA